MGKKNLHSLLCVLDANIGTGNETRYYFIHNAEGGLLRVTSHRLLNYHCEWKLSIHSKVWRSLWSFCHFCKATMMGGWRYTAVSLLLHCHCCHLSTSQSSSAATMNCLFSFNKPLHPEIVFSLCATLPLFFICEVCFIFEKY